MKPVAYPKKMYGKFYEGDTYLVLKTTKKEDSSALDYDLFFWLGSKSSQDEQGVAAYKAVELDEQLGGAAVQHRETQGHESQLFLQTFKSVEYKKGGVASGFNKVERDVYETRLLHLKGQRSVRVEEVPLKASSLNAGDVFILDEGLKIYQWNGAQANKKEKTKALEVTCMIRDNERDGRALIEIFDQGGESDEFWKLLGGKGTISDVIPDDPSKESVEKGTVQLIKVSDASGSVSETVVASSGPLSKEMLGTDDVYIVDTAVHIFVWVGKGSTAEERRSGMSKGIDYIGSKGRPTWTKVSKVMEGAETAEFRSNFASWPSVVDYTARRRGNVAPSAANGASADDLSKKMSELGAEAPKPAMVDDGSGTVECYRIEDFEPVQTEKHLLGHLFAGDSYVIKYTYNDGSDHMLYFWQGSQSSADERSAAALHAVKMDDDLGGNAVQVRVVQGKEPPHFVAIFKGALVVHSGGRASGFSNSTEDDLYDTDGVSLFQVRGTEATDTKAVQVEEKAGSLNSGDCFVLLTPSTMYVWTGSISNEQERETAHKVASLMKGKRSLADAAEGSESGGFWDALGGKAEYATKKQLPEMGREPLLFQCSNKTGTFDINPMYDFSQADLEQDDVYILDTFTTIFVWLGSEANEQEKKQSVELADKYIKQAGYDSSTSVVQVKSGSEPRTFTANFLAWDPSATKAYVDPYQAKMEAALAEQAETAAALEAAQAAKAAERAEALAKLEAEKEAAAAKASAEAKKAEPEPEPAAAPKPAAAAGFKDPASFRLPYEDLKDKLPDGVDPKNKEQYLSDADFQKALGVSRAEFNEMKGWKQQQAKKAAGLF